MKANELRIGNYVNLIKQGYNDNLQVTEIHNKKICLQNSKEAFLDFIKPVPLTEEWLTNLGAENYKDFFIHGRFMLQWIKGHNYWYVTDEQFKTYLTKIEFVNEWQNLFFALTQKELTLIN